MSYMLAGQLANMEEVIIDSFIEDVPMLQDFTSICPISTFEDELSNLSVPSSDVGIEATDLGSLLEQFEEVSDTLDGDPNHLDQMCDSVVPEMEKPARNRNASTERKELTEEFLQKIKSVTKQKSAVMLPLAVPAKRGRGRTMTHGHPVALPDNCTPRTLQRVMSQHQDLTSNLPEIPMETEVTKVRKKDDVAAVDENYFELIMDHDYIRAGGSTVHTVDGNVTIKHEQSDIIKPAEKATSQHVQKNIKKPIEKVTIQHVQNNIIKPIENITIQHVQNNITKLAGDIAKLVGRIVPGKDGQSILIKPSSNNVALKQVTKPSSDLTKPVRKDIRIKPITKRSIGETKPASDNVTKPVTKPVTDVKEPASESVLTMPITNPVADVTNLANENVIVKPVTKQVADVIKLANENVIIKPVATPVNDVKKLARENIIQQLTEAVAGDIIKPVVGETIRKHVSKPTRNYRINHVKKATGDVSKPASENVRNKFVTKPTCEKSASENVRNKQETKPTSEKPAGDTTKLAAEMNVRVKQECEECVVTDEPIPPIHVASQDTALTENVTSVDTTMIDNAAVKLDMDTTMIDNAAAKDNDITMIDNTAAAAAANVKLEIEDGEITDEESEQSVPTKPDNGLRRTVSDSSEDGQYFDKLPSYFTALSIPRKSTKKTASHVAGRGGISVHDYIERDVSPVRDASGYNKIPDYYSSFTNSTRYDNMSSSSLEEKSSSGYCSAANLSPARCSPSPTLGRSRSRSCSRSRSNSQSRSSCRTSLKDRGRSSFSPYSRCSSRSRSCSRSSCSGCSSRSRSCSSSSSCSTCDSRSSSMSRSPSRSPDRAWEREARFRGDRSKRRRSRSRSRSYSRHKDRSYSPASYRSRSRSHSPSERSPLQDYRMRRRGEKKMEREVEKEQQMKERRIVYVGGLPNKYTRHQLRSSFGRFGEIEHVQLHFREHGDNYGFVTFAFTCDAYAAIEKGRSVPGLEKFDLCFGGRRQFCDVEYADLDGNKEVEEEFETKPKSDGFDFDELLRQARQKLKK